MSEHTYSTLSGVLSLKGLSSITEALDIYALTPKISTKKMTEPDAWGLESLTIDDVGLVLSSTSELDFSAEFSENLGSYIAAGLLEPAVLNHYSAPLKDVIEILLKFSEGKPQSDHHTQLAAALDEYLGGLQ